VADELAKFGPSWAIGAPGVFVQEVHEPSISRALSMASKATESV
jgi:hypothetical protein